MNKIDKLRKKYIKSVNRVIAAYVIQKFFRMKQEQRKSTQNTKNTKNTKGNRKLVEAYHRVINVFKIPDDLDLEDKSVVSKWYVEYDTLYINYVDARKKRYQCRRSRELDNYESQSEALIVDEDEHGGGFYSEDED